MKAEQMRDYYLGLEMGETAVAYAATTPDYELLRAKGKDLWGVRLFQRAELADERRLNRTSRRCLKRAKARQGLLRELFEPAIIEVDSGFYIRLDESKFQMQERSEDNKQPYGIFNDKNYTDKDYYRDYPTIFHLIKELIESKEAHDPRLVYLAIENIFKRRGNFLNASMDDEGDERTISMLYGELTSKAEEYGICLPKDIDLVKMEEILGERGASKKQVLENLSELTGIKKKDKAAYQLLAMMCGSTVKMIDIYGPYIIQGDENKKLSLCIQSASYEEAAVEIASIVGEDGFELIEVAKVFHDRGQLSGMMKGYTYLAQARVASYEEHQRDLSQLKAVLKKYDKKAYDEMFRVMKDGNYSAYVGSVNSSKSGGKKRRNVGGRSREDLYKTIRKVMKNLPQDDPDVQDILDKMDAEIFLPKQLTAENGIIPHQLHSMELKAILNNAENYLPFLTEKDGTGLTVSEKIIQVFNFQIPYYVGPLGHEYKDVQGYNVWAERKKGKIYPWNFEQMVDLPRTAEKFIERMVRHCTYLTDSKALPNTSPMYENYKVLNELNNVRVYGNKLSVEIKQDIYKDLFRTGKKVSRKRLLKYLTAKGLVSPGDEAALSGFDGDFKSSLTTIGKFYGMMGETVYEKSNMKMIEDIVFWGTVYGQDKKFLRTKINEVYPGRFTEQEIKRILGFKFEGWGKLSADFLQMNGASKEDRVSRSIITALWETNDNLQELMSSRYTYHITLDSMVSDAEKPLTEWTIEELDGLYMPAPIKRMVWQTIGIVREVRDTLGCDPNRVFIKISNENSFMNRSKSSRKQKLLKLYKELGKEGKKWKGEIEKIPEEEFRRKKVYLYYQQMGRCMYTGKPIDFEKLMQDNSTYNLDHIYPKHYVKDDNIENNLVLVDKNENKHKEDKYPVETEIRESQQNFWQYLFEKGFITQTKYLRLVRSTEFSDEEKAEFIERQIDQKGYGKKTVRKILKQAFPDTDIVFAKADNISDFRKRFGLVKSQAVNNHYHAKEAYLSIVVGNAYFVKFTSNPLNFIKAANKDPERKVNKYHMDKIFEWSIERNGEVAWKAESVEDEGTIKTVRKVHDRNSVIVTRRCTEIHGAITQKATIYGAEVAKEGSYMPVKTKDTRLADVTRYGGVTSIATAGYSLLEYKAGKDTVRSLEAVPVYLTKGKSIKELDENVLVDYFTRSLQNMKKPVTDIHIRMKLIPVYSLIKYDGCYYYLGGKSNNMITIRNAMELCLDPEIMEYAKKLEKAYSTSDYKEIDSDKDFVLTKEKNEKFYACIKDKYENSIYRYQKGTLKEFVIAGEKMFKKLNLEEQVYVLMQIINNIKNGENADLLLLGGSKQSGTMRMSKNIKADELVLITQSAAGLNRKEFDLLHG